MDPVKYLLDTNVLSEAVKTAPDRRVMAMMEAHQEEIATASPVYHELEYGCRRLPVSRKRDVEWLVIFGSGGVMETAFPPRDIDDYLYRRGFVRVGIIEEVLKWTRKAVN